MKVLTKEAVEKMAQEAESVQDFVAMLDEGNFIRDEPKLSLSKRQVVDILKLSDRVRTEMVSSYLLKRLVDAGWLVRTKDHLAVNIGRRPYLYLVSKKGENLIRLSQFWPKTENDENEEEEVSNETENV